MPAAALETVDAEREAAEAGRSLLLSLAGAMGSPEGRVACAMIPTGPRSAEWRPWRPGDPDPQLWHDLRAHWRHIERVSICRHNQKLAYASTRLMNRDPHLIEIASECVYALATGLMPNVGLIAAGDDGADFTGSQRGSRVDVKGATYWGIPILKHQPTKAEIRSLKADGARADLAKEFSSDFYVMVGLWIEERCGWIAGHATRSELDSAPFEDFGHGAQHSLYPPGTPDRRCFRRGLPPPHAGMAPRR